jgi:hypothetical protein
MSEESIRIIHNAICVICSTVLAIVFQKWPLVFLACLFWIFRKD